MKCLTKVGLCFIIILLSRCSFKPIIKERSIGYDGSSGLKLDVYAPKKKNGLAASPHKVLVFIHGGNWTSGRRSLYKFFGKGMARKDIVCVVIDYRLSPETNYRGMAQDAATAVYWVKQHISGYNGDTSQIFISGHSAGAHLAALISLDSTYFHGLHMINPVKGIVLIDPFGLDMYAYLRQSLNEKDAIYYPVFSTDAEIWKKASPVSYLNKDMPPFLIFLGSKTYPAIKKGATDFLKSVQPYQPLARFIDVKGKKHAGMIFQFYNPRNKAYSDILNFMRVH